MKRTFIGLKIDTDASILRLFDDLRKNLPYRQLHWIDPKNLHLTLRFLGNTEEDQISFINNELENLTKQYNAQKLEIHGLGMFGSKNFPRILWVGIKMPQEFFQMINNIENIVSDAGFERETKPYSPHLTLCRIKNLKETDALFHLIEKYKNSFVKNQEVKEIVLYQSILKSSGSEYYPIKTFFLNNPN